MRVHAALLVLALPFSFSIQAAAPVVDIGNSPTPSIQAATTQVQRSPVATQQEPVSVASGDVHYQLQLLQDEVRTLRGMVEELSNEVSRLKSQQMDDYMDLDRRISKSTSAPDSIKNSIKPPVSQPIDNKLGGANTVESRAKSTPAAVGSAEETEHYSHAYNQLKAGNVSEAITLFKAHYSKYPNGKYVANSHYWLGEIYVLQNQLENARKSFSMVVDNYPAHRKASDATFKLGQVYHLLGNKAKAKVLLEKAASGNDNAARLACNYLNENF